MWELRLGRDKFSIDAAMKKGRELPEWYMEEPFLYPGDSFYLKSFDDLSTCRQVGMGLGRIPYPEIRLYGQHHGLIKETLVAFIKVIKALDLTYLDWQEKEAERLRPKPRK